MCLGKGMVLRMEEIIKQKKGKNKAIFIIIAIIGIIFLIFGFTSYNKKEEEKKWFDVTETEEYSYIDAQYLEGPYVEETSENSIKKEYYLAINQNIVVGCILIKQNSTTEIPIVTTEEEYNNAIAQDPKRMYGYSKNFESEVSKIFIEEINEELESNEVNSSNISEYIGKYYLDTTAKSEDKESAITSIVLGAIMIFLFVAYLIKNNKDYKKIQKEISELIQDGKYDMYDNDINLSNSYTEKKYLTIMGNKNIYNFENKVLVIPIQKITNVYKCSMENGQISQRDYICIETNENEVYNIAFKPRDKKDDKFDNLLNQIKQRMVK